MKWCRIIFYVLLFLSFYTVSAQTSADCTAAIPICNNTPVNGIINGFGIDDFNGANATGCLESNNTVAIESNSAWYHFRTGASGELGFNISFNTSEDWDFALYKTNNCSNLGDPIRCNFFDNAEEVSYAGVGEDPSGNIDNFQYEDWLQVEPGEDYYLLINNFSNNNTGFSIQFSGNIFATNPNDALDCSIINNLLGAPKIACANENVVLDATTTGATYEWFLNTGNGFGRVIGEANALLNASILGSGTYRVRVTTTDETIISDVQVVFSDLPLTYEVTNDFFCKGDVTYDLYQKNNEVLGGQSPDNFLIGYYASLVDAINQTNPLPRYYEKSLGEETFYVTVASKDNPKCIDTPWDFTITGEQTPELNFEEQVFLCEGATAIVIGEQIPNINYSYEWSTGETTPTINVDEAGVYTVTVTNTTSINRCSLDKEVAVYISTTPKIKEVLFNEIQRNNTVTIVADLEGNYEYRLDDSDYQKSNVFTNVLPGMHRVELVDLNGCGTSVESIVVVGFLNFFTPNSDGSNDTWNIIGIRELDNPEVVIYDAFGKILKRIYKDSSPWDGTYNGVPMPSSDYWFKLSYVDFDGQRRIAKFLGNHFTLKR